MALRDRRQDCVPLKDPLERPDYIESDVQAIRALQRGEATPRQQVQALEWMVQAFGTHDASFRPGDPTGTAFAEGRRNAGMIIIWMLNSAPTKTDPDKIAIRNTEQGNDGTSDPAE
jgi:hypothetical protein